MDDVEAGSFSVPIVFMASIRKDPRDKSPYWFAVITLPNGVRTTRSTKSKNRGEAHEIAQKLQRLQDGLKRKLRKENRDQIMQLMETGIETVQKAAKGELTEVEGRKFVNDLRIKTGQEPLQFASVQDYFREWIASKRLTRAKGTVLRYENTIETFLAYLGQRARGSLAAITPRDVEKFRDLQLKEGKNETTANMAVKTLRIPFNKACKHGILTNNPANAVELLAAENASRSVFALEMLHRLMEIADRDWRGMIFLGAWAGLRISDAAALNWSNIDWDNKFIHLSPQKQNRAQKRKIVSIPMHPYLEQYLLELPIKDQAANTPLFPTLSCKRVGGTNGLSLTFRKLMQRAGIDSEAVNPEVRGKGRKFYQLGFHSLRKTFVSALANNGVSEEIRMKIAGHASAEVHQRYTKIEMETLSKALEKFPLLLPQALPKHSQGIKK